MRRVLPGNRDDECELPPYSDDPDAVATAMRGTSAGQGAGSSDGGGGGSDQGSGFVEAVREAAAALDVSGAKEVGSRLAGKVRDKVEAERGTPRKGSIGCIHMPAGVDRVVTVRCSVMGRM